MKPHIPLIAVTTTQHPFLQEDPRIVFIRRKQVEEITGLSRSGIYAQMIAGTFPQNVPIGLKGVRWIKSEILAWCKDKIDQRG